MTGLVMPSAPSVPDLVTTSSYTPGLVMLSAPTGLGHAHAHPPTWVVEGVLRHEGRAARRDGEDGGIAGGGGSLNGGIEAPSHRVLHACTHSHT